MRNPFSFVIIIGLVGLGQALAGCATGEPVSERPRSPTGHFERVVDNAGFPARRTTALPTVRASSPRFASAGPLSTRVELCVGRDGDTTRVKLAASSGDRAYDDAILEDVAHWRYEPLQNAGLACEQATVTYVP